MSSLAVMDEHRRKFPEVRFWLAASALFVVALALRWYRLDLMMFRYDQAEVAARAMETFRSGLPVTGIVNSLGFRNAVGYVWTVLPAFFISPDPRLATAWHGLLAATMIFPLAILGRRYRHDGFAWLPAVMAAVLPVSVFAGRSLWAQYLLPACAAWGIWALDGALRQEEPIRRRFWMAAFCLVILAWATSIHFSAALLVLIGGLFLISGFRSQLKQLAVAALPAVVIFLTMIPSAMSWWESKTNPEPKPDFVLVYESMLPPPFPLWVRLQEAVEFTFWSRSVDAVPGMELLWEQRMLAPVRPVLFDAVIAGICVAGALFAFLALLRRRTVQVNEQGHQMTAQPMFPIILLAWLFIPAAMAAIFVSRINAGYFLGSMPALWLLTLCFPAVKGLALRIGCWVLAIVVFAGGVAISGLFLEAIGQNGFVPGNYYITYGKQAEVVRFVDEAGVKPGRLTHLSGEWYQRSYDYIHRHVVDGPVLGGGAVDDNYAVMEDKNLRPDEPARVKFFWTMDPAAFGDVGVVVFPSRGQAELFAQAYYEVGER